jgi:diacylglycerol O-acyltransferase / wax synthase
VQQLSGLDAAFLALETANSTAHIGGVSILDPTDAPTLDLARLTELMSERLPLVPVLRRRLRHVPFGLDQPYWMDDPDFDIEYHVRELALPRPGSDGQLNEQIARLHARPLDRRRPLWEIYLITGLADGRIVVYTKLHHSAVDGVSGAELLTILLDLSPEGRELPPLDESPPVGVPHPFALVARAARRLTLRPVELVRITNGVVRALPNLAPAIGAFVGEALGLNRGDGGIIENLTGLAPTTPFNGSITPHRRVAFRSVDLDTVKAVKNAHGISVNDVVMAMCAGALRRWLVDHDALPDSPLVAMIPVSVRDDQSKGAMGNKVSAMLVRLPTHLDDPYERLRVAHEATTIAKSKHAAIPQGLVDSVTEFAPPALIARAARVVFATGLLHRVPPFNLCISNVPGPNIPVYMGGCRLLAQYPVSVIADGQGLNITLVGYLGRLHFGLLACRELVPDIDTLAGYIAEELDVLAKVVAERDADSDC